MREHGRKVAAWILSLVMIITMIVPYGGAGISSVGKVKAADLIDLSGKDGTHTIVVEAANSTYNGQAIETEVVVKVDGDEVPSDCYDVVYTNNTNATTSTKPAVATITGKTEKGYTGTNKANFQIKKASLSTGLSVTFEEKAVNGKRYVPYIKNLYNWPTITSVKWNKITLTEGKDYYEEPKPVEEIGAAGKTIIYAEDKGNFSGSKSYTWYLAQADIADQIVTLDKTSYTYDGTEKKPSVRIADVNSWQDSEDDYQYLEEGIDYTLSYSNNTNAGTASVTITGINCYKGTKTVNFTITNSSSGGDTGAKDISAASVTVASCTYNGTAQTPTVTVKDGSTTLRQGTDYTVQYASNTNAGTGTVTITGCGKYKNTKKATFTIARRNLSNATLTAAAGTYNYGAAVTSSNITVKDNGLGRILTNNTDYTIGSYNAVNVGNVTITATGKGNYTGTVSGTFTVNALNVSSVAAVTLNQTEFTQTGSEIKPTVTAVTAGGHTLRAGTDYTVSYQNNTAVGTAAKVIVTFKGNYTGSKTVYFTIKANSSSGGDTGAKDISAASVTVASCTYNGTAQTPTVTVKDGSTTLRQGTDYTVQYASNTNAGTGTVTITGCGKYRNTKTATFPIARRNLSECSVSYDENVNWTGSAVIPKISITYGRISLAEGTDYTVSYANNMNETTSATATVVCKGNFTGSRVLTYKIVRNRVNISSSDITVDGISDQEYNDGKEIRPDVVVRNGGTILKQNTDYILAYSSNYYAGTTAVITITGINDYTGSRTVSFNIKAVDLTNAQVVLERTQYEYIGTPFRPAVTSLTTTSGRTYTSMAGFYVDYTNNLNCGTATVTITGKSSNFTGKGMASFTITAKSLALCQAEYSKEMLYTGAEVKPSVKLTCGSYVLAEGTDYTVSYNNNTNETENASITVTGKGNFSGTRTYQFKITKVITNINDSSISIDSVGDQEYRGGTEVIPQLTIRKNGVALVKGENYTLSVTNNKTLGSTATVTITGIGSYTGTRTLNFKIVAADITDASVELAQQTYEYTGSSIIPTVTKLTTASGTEISSMSEFYITYSRNKNVGTATIKIEADSSNYKGTATTTFEIDKKMLDDSLIMNVASAIYSGKEVVPDTTVIFNGRTLVKGSDYIVRFSSNINSGTAAANIVGYGNYEGMVVKHFTIQPKTLSGCTVSYDDQMKYTGEPVCPDVKVMDGTTELQKDTDYTVTYYNNTNATANAVIKLEGKGNYTGTVEKTFVIKSDKKVIDLSKAEVTAANQTYNGTAWKPSVTVKVSGKVINPSEYKVTYSGNVNAGTAQITVTGLSDSVINKGHGSFTIKPKQIAGCTVSYTKSMAYTGKTVTPSVAVKDIARNAILTAGSSGDYTVSYQSNMQPTTKAVIKITGRGNYTGTLTQYFTIVKQITPVARINLSSATVTVADQIYTGKALTPAVTAVLKGKTLKPNTDYTVSYSNNVKVGTAKVVLTGKGNYTGSVTRTFVIKAKTTPNVKKPGTTKKVTVSKISTTSAKVTWKKVTGADGYRIYQKQGSGKKKLVKTVGKNVASYSAKKLKAGTQYTYSVCAYKKSGTSKVSGAEKSKTFVTKPSKIKSVKTTTKSKACRISWKKVSGASGYQVYMANSKNGKYKKIGDTKKLNLTKKGLKKGKTYYFKVRAYKTLNKKKTYGAYSVKVKAKIK